LGGLTKDQMVERIQAGACRQPVLPMPEPRAMSYMMFEKPNISADGPGIGDSHLMFHLPPPMGAASWGANLDGSPGRASIRYHHDWPEPENHIPWCLSTIGLTEAQRRIPKPHRH